MPVPAILNRNQYRRFSVAPVPTLGKFKEQSDMNWISLIGNEMTAEQYINSALHLISYKVNGEIYIHISDCIDVMEEYHKTKLYEKKS